ncbi:MAG: hypothetical protein JXB07_16755, partial [Anaerolineae bacterium]|nr:hypothetical protein [Anaerolineae bacterium]
MSDELIEGHALRGKSIEPQKEASQSSERIDNKTPSADEPTGPYIRLEPPPEAGNVITQQSEMATFHRGLTPIIVEQPASEPPVDQPTPEALPSDDLGLAPDLPWAVIETSSSESPDTTGTEFPEKAAANRDEPSDFLPHFHTPTGAFPPIRELPADEE